LHGTVHNEASDLTPNVLVISTKLDIATDSVVSVLSNRSVPVTRWNSEDFPFDQFLTTILSSETRELSGVAEPSGRPAVDFDSISRIWYRRIRVPERPETFSPGIYEFCMRESRAALVGTILGLRKRIMSPPANIWAAEHKIFQLATAKSVGLSVPETIVTNKPAAVRDAFARFSGNMISKAVRSGFAETDSGQLAIYTSQVLEEHLAAVEDARWSPAIYQPLISKKSDVRVTVVGERLFAAEIDSQSDAASIIDWRRTSNPDLPHRTAVLPGPVSEALRQLVSLLGLTFAAIDLIRTRDDEYIFLEVNPNGQWLWLDEILGLGISDAIADWLSS